MELLKELCETPAVPGREQALIDIFERELGKTTDRVSVDGMGNVTGLRRGSGKDGKKIMVAAHMDEIGFIVTHIDKKGFIRFAGRGGHIPRTLVSQRVRIHGKKAVSGVVEGAPWALKPEDMTKAPALKDLFIDTGLAPKELAKRVEVGDMIVMDRGFTQDGDICISKAFDDRIGCYVLLEAMRKLKKTQVDVYAVGTTQEEVGLRGAQGAALAVTPNIGVALDVTAAFDVPGVPEHQQVTQMGKGVAIKINDSASISNHGIVKMLKKLAKKHRIPHQLEILPFGGTDARGMQVSAGGPVCTLSIPARHLHSPNEMLDIRDVKAAIDLLVRFLENAHACTLEF